MATKAQDAVSTRRIPRQERAARTVDLVFQATARIIETQGLEALTTNAVARTAGISIGSLYEYFPNKEAILVAMTRQMLREDERIVTEAIAAALSRPGADVVRETVRAFIALYDMKPEVRRAIMRVHIMLGLADEHTIPVRAVVDVVQAHRTQIFGARSAPLSPTRILVLVRAVAGVVRSLFNDKSPLLYTRELEDEIIVLIESYAAAETAS
jgi:AcrR family transcriptional regulator